MISTEVRHFENIAFCQESMGQTKLIMASDLKKGVAIGKACKPFSYVFNIRDTISLLFKLNKIFSSKNYYSIHFLYRSVLAEKQFPCQALLCDGTGSVSNSSHEPSPFIQQLMQCLKNNHGEAVILEHSVMFIMCSQMFECQSGVFEVCV